MVRVAINGYGRIGRISHRVILKDFTDKVDIVAINVSSSTDITGWMYLLKYDSAYGPLTHHEIKVNVAEKGASMAKNGYIGDLLIDGKKVPVFSQKDPNLLPWKTLNVDVVIESTGAFRTEEKLKMHLLAGAKSAVLSAPIKEGDVSTYILSVNARDYKGEKLISNASCTTNCIAPVAKVMMDNFGIEKAMMTTIHGYTSDQRLQDGGHKDYRRARAAAENIIPTTTGATEATVKTLPELTGIFSGLAIRVPVGVGSLSDFTFLLKKNTTKEEVNNVFVKASTDKPYQGILKHTYDPIVSSDIIGDSHSAIVDLSLTQVVGGNLVKVIAWYDNEWGYCYRLVEEAIMVGEKISG